MEITIQTRDLPLNDQLRDYVQKKLTRLGRHLPEASQAQVLLARASTKQPLERMVAQVTVNVNGLLVRSEERAATIQTALDGVADALDRRVERLKGKLYKSEQAKRSSGRDSMRELEALPEGPAPEDAEGTEQVVRVKRFLMDPMTVDQAIEQMELLGHTFFLFLNSATGEYSVVYRRRVGDYGLIEPTRN